MATAPETSATPNVAEKKEFNPDKVTPFELFGFTRNIIQGQNIHKKRPGIPKEARISVLLEESLKQNEENGLLAKTMASFTIPDNDARSVYRKMVRVALLLHPDIVDAQNLLLNTMFFNTKKSALAGMWVCETRLAHYLLSLPELKGREDEVKAYVRVRNFERKKSPIHKFVPARFTKVVEHPTLVIDGRKVWITAYEKNELHNRFRVLQYLKEHEEIWADEQRDVAILDALLPLWK